MFITWKLWTALRYPQRQHPIFRYANTQTSQHNDKSDWWRAIQILLFLSFLLFALFSPSIALASVLGLAVIIPLLILIFNGTVLGLKWIQSITTQIRCTHDENRFDLLRLTSQGALGASWLIATGVIHRNNWQRLAYRILNWVVTIALTMLGLALVMIMLGRISAVSDMQRLASMNVLRDVLYITFFVIALWLDHIQSIIIALLLGILLPNIKLDKAFLRTMTPIIFLAIQILSYLVIFVVYTLMRIVMTGLWGDSFVSLIAVAGMTLLGFYCLREIIITLLWNTVLMQYDAVDSNISSSHIFISQSQQIS